MLERKGQLGILLFGFVLYISSSLIHADMKVRLSCFGDDVKLECPLMKVLMIHLTSLSVPPDNSSLCSNRNDYLVPCDLISYTSSLKRECTGKRRCIMEDKKRAEIKRTCKANYVVTVIYECRPMKLNSTARTTAATDILRSTTTGVPTKTRPGDKEAWDGRKLSSGTYLFYTLLSATMALQYMQGRPKHLILCFVLSISAGIVILMITVLLMACIEKIIEESKKKDSTAIEISSPLLITPSNIQATSTQIESTQTSEAGSGQREATLPRIQSIRRCQSVDEGTQTEREATEVFDVDNGLSDTEAKELGYLVDIMRYYNSNLSNMPSSDEPFSIRVETPSETETATSNLHKDRTEKPYTGPRIVDTSRRRQPRLSSATYSSSNNSENGDAAVFLSTSSAKQNHIYTRTPTISTLPRRRPYLNAKTESPKLAMHYLTDNDSPRIPNGPRSRIGGRTRFADENSNMGRQYGTLN